MQKEVKQRTVAEGLVLLLIFSVAGISCQSFAVRSRLRVIESEASNTDKQNYILLLSYVGLEGKTSVCLTRLFPLRAFKPSSFADQAHRSTRSRPTLRLFQKH